MEKIKIFLWELYRNVINIKTILLLKPFLCRLGFHKMRRGMGWSSHQRFDGCKCCDYSKWVEDELGCKIMNKKK